MSVAHTCLMHSFWCRKFEEYVENSLTLTKWWEHPPYCPGASPRGKIKMSVFLCWRGRAYHHWFHKHPKNLSRERKDHLFYLLFLGMLRVLTVREWKQTCSWQLPCCPGIVLFWRAIQYLHIWKDHHITWRNYLLPCQSFPNLGYFTHPLSWEVLQIQLQKNQLKSL